MFPAGSRSTLRSAVTDQLREWVGTGYLRSGAHLAEVELSRTLQVSRATLREAMRSLVQEGLLTEDNRGRVSVTTLNAREIRDLFEVRIALESTALSRLCAEEDRQPCVVALRRQLDSMNNVDVFPNGIRADLEFHELLCALTGNDTLLNSWQNLRGLIRIAMVSSGMAVARSNMSRDRHEPIVQFIAEGDALRANRYLESHMRTALDALLSAGRTGPSRSTGS